MDTLSYIWCGLITQLSMSNLCHYDKKNHIGDEGVIALAEVLKVNESVRDVFLNFNSISSKGAIALAEVLKINDNIVKLDISDNSIGDEGAVALAEALKVNSTVTAINLAHNSIGKRCRCVGASIEIEFYYY
ncbi:hypothetical protein GEMRC1_001022 [Eukaryota sp. GEM-RC1]